MGYRQTTWRTIGHPNERERSRAYAKYKDAVYLLALEAGFRDQGGRAHKGNPPSLSVLVLWKKEPRIDWANVYKAVEDSVWHKSDRYVQPGKKSSFLCNTGEERAEVEISF